MNNTRDLNRKVAQAFYRNFTHLREAQQASIEPILGGHNLVLSAGTGSGKTEAVMAPLVSLYWKEIIELDSLLIAYISPTRALVNDLYRRLEPIFDYMGLRVGIRHGDRDDVRKKTPPNVVITTPESLDVMLLRQDRALRQIRAVVIDESHLLYNTQRGVQLSVLLQRLQKFIEKPPLQMVAMSATIGNMIDTARLVFGQQSNTKFLRFPSNRTIDAVVRSDNETELISRITRARDAKILGFVNSRKIAEYLSGELSSEPQLDKSVFTHYSTLSKNVRQEIEEEFAKKSKAVCFATSTLELGIDIGDIDVVMLCGIPSGNASFLQRIGRGNRREQKSNVACFVGSDSILSDKPSEEPPLIEALRYVSLIDTAKQGQFPLQGRYELFGAVVQQCLSLIASRKGSYTDAKELIDIFKHLGYISEEILNEILGRLVLNGYLIRHGIKNQYGAGESLHQLVKTNRIYGNFPAEPRMVKLVQNGQELGKLPIPSLINISKGMHVLFLGKKWTISNIEEDVLHLKPAPQGVRALPFRYIGQKPQFDAFLTDKMWHLIHSRDFPQHLLHEDLRENFERARLMAQSLYSIEEIPCTMHDKKIRYYTFGGYLVNRAVALINGEKDRDSISDCCLEVESAIDWKSLPTDPQEYSNVFSGIAKKGKAKSIFQKLLPVEYQVREGIQEWLCDEAIGNVLKRLKMSTPRTIDRTDQSIPLESSICLITGEKIHRQIY